MPLFNVSSLNKITENNQKSDLTNQTKNEHKHILRQIKKKKVVVISLKLQDLLLERVIYYPYVNIYTLTSWCEIKKKDNK